MNHARHRQKNGVIAEETISLSDSMTKGQNNRRRTMPAEVNLGRSMRGRRVTPSDSHVMTVNSGTGERDSKLSDLLLEWAKLAPNNNKTLYRKYCTFSMFLFRITSK